FSQQQWCWGLIEHYGGLAPFDPRNRQAPFYQADSVAWLQAQPPRWSRADRMVDISATLKQYDSIADKAEPDKLYLAQQKLCCQIPDSMLLGLQLAQAMQSIQQVMLCIQQ